MSVIDDELWMANDWKSINDNEVKLNFTMSNMLQYFINREAVDGKPANDFMNISTKTYPLFRAGHHRRLQDSFSGRAKENGQRA